MEWVHRPRKKIWYLNIAASFDIETTSYRNQDGEKRACMYVWMVCIHGKSWYARTWEEFRDFIDRIVGRLHLDEEHRLILWVHNLSYEMQFIRKMFDWSNVFALNVREPVYAAAKCGIEFRCSYILHGASLEHMGKSLVELKVEKAVGDLDYNILRHSGTPLTDTELNSYCLKDVQVVVAYIEECIRYEKRIDRIPLTKTGYPRRRCRKAMLQGPNGWKNRNRIHAMQLSLEELQLWDWEFAGGFAHTNANCIDRKLHAHGKDETSAYPFQCLAFDGYPMGPGRKVFIKDMNHFRRCIENFACVFHVKLTGIRPKPGVPDHILGFSKCRNVKNKVLDNGRIVSADELETVFNEIDFQCFEAFYDYDHIAINEFWRYNRGYLPKEYILTILQLYNDKTLLKGVKGREQDYQMSKGDLNGLYGMMAQRVCRDSIEYSGDEWHRQYVNYEEGLEKYNSSMTRFVSYPWGCYVTSTARAALFEAILELKDDFIYSDTDSVKYRNYEAHEAFFEAYNKRCEKRLRKMCEFYDIDFELCRPMGRLIGVWDDEGEFDIKCLGAKRYMTQHADDPYPIITVSGLDKRKTSKWMHEHFQDPWEAFTNNLDVSPEHTGKLTHTYIDVPTWDILTDFTGKTMQVHELSSVHLEPSGYSLSMSKEFLRYLSGLRGE